jgi:hypothetical protein
MLALVEEGLEVGDAVEAKEASIGASQIIIIIRVQWKIQAWWNF